MTFTARQTGDPYLNYIGGTSTKVGRWLLVKYNNHSVIPRMQLYMAQGAGITSDNNMIEFPSPPTAAAGRMSLWIWQPTSSTTRRTRHLFSTSALTRWRHALERRLYQFTGEEAIDVAYIMGFTTKAGLMGYTGSQ